MKHGSLFSGIGGFDLAAEWMGWENVFHCEWNDFGKRVLKYYWPNAISYDDIKKTDFTIHRGSIDILTGGFPCQPYSAAGKRLGKEDERHLWPEMLRAIREIQPRYIVGENVRGLTNWNGGMVFDEVQADLEIEGYEVLPFLLPACAVNAPHRRDRIWFIAHAKSGRSNRASRESGKEVGRQEGNNAEQPFIGSEIRTSTNSQNIRLQGWEFPREKWGLQKQFGRPDANPIGCAWEDFPLESPICGEHDGLPDKLDRITFSKWRTESIKAYGNAIVPQVALQIFKAIAQFESQI